MPDDPPSKWLDIAGKASRWTLKVGTKGVELAKTELERKRQEAAERKETARLDALKPVEETEVYKKFYTKLIDDNLSDFGNGVFGLKSDSELRAYCRSKVYSTMMMNQMRAAHRDNNLNELTDVFVNNFPGRIWRAFEVLRPSDFENYRVYFRATQLEADAAIRSFHKDRMNSRNWETSDLVINRKVKAADGSWYEAKLDLKFEVARPFSSMTDSEITILTYADLLSNYSLISTADHTAIVLPILYNDGNCKQIVTYNINLNMRESLGIKSDADMIRFGMEHFGHSNKKAAIEKFLLSFSDIEKKYPNNAIVKEFRSKLLGGSNWLTDHELSNSVFSHEASPSSVFVGATEAGGHLWYTGEGALITIAPPGSGKTQCHVFTNLLTYDGPAVVLDVKGECFAQTSAWRKANVGPVFKFNPLQPADSARYNPLAFIENDPETLWEDCRLLADLLIVPENRQDASWENRGRDVVAGVIAWLVRTQEPQDRRMGRIVDVVSKIDWDKFVDEAKYVMEVPPLSRLGNALAVMPERQLEGVLDAARRHLTVWEGARVERVTSSSDWNPELLRDGSNSTIYICIPPNEIETYAPLLRVIFAQHLRHLLRVLPPRGQKPILFMLDELPRIGPMRPVEEALEVGRQYGIRLWMFAQSLGQLEKSYVNADGMIGSCGVRVFMNPSSHDGTAKRLSEELGFVESVIDSSRQLMVEATDLSGPAFADYQIALARNTRPLKLKKIFAYNDPAFAARLG